MINKYWDIQSVTLVRTAASEGDLIAYGVPIDKPGEPVLA